MLATLESKTPWDDWTTPSNFLNYAKLEVEYYHDVYEYNFEGTTTKLAWAVLLSHVALVVWHFVSTIWHGNWHSSAWEQLGDLVTLGLNSSVGEGERKRLLRNPGVRVGRRETWRLVARVCEADDGRRVELRLSDESRDAKKKALDAEHGGDEGDQGVPPRAFRKYG
ncbi:hypothetical protein QBC35DRAFT_78282 [Podospora australis]|uniref:Uncharacterized protein n=1 Tax=Podospora australis TaxID=1536484 RepID=A0AAN6WL75_9PEZI|nr:hypothetical protein QBC35DRAFT_78282 [Podospora australis]